MVGPSWRGGGGSRRRWATCLFFFALADPGARLALQRNCLNTLENVLHDKTTLKCAWKAIKFYNEFL
jgi:hypothetical protein